jgi:hypothetical protein
MDDTGIKLIQQGWRVKPGQRVDLGKKTVVFYSWQKNKSAITIYNITSTMYDYVFRSEQASDLDAVSDSISRSNNLLTQAAQDADMLLKGPVKDTDFC